MSPVLRAAAALAVIASLGIFGARRTNVGWNRATPSPNAPRAAECPEGQLADHGVCIPVPAASEPSGRGEGVARAPEIPLRPDRPKDPLAYVYPIDLAPSSAPSHPNAETVRALGPGGSALGFVLPANDNAHARPPALDGQSGDPIVAYAGPLLGGALATLHRTRENSRERWYVVLLGSLASPPSLEPGAPLPAGFDLGVAGTTITADRPSLYLAVRRVRDGIDPTKLDIDSLLREETSMACDPRNVIKRK